MINNHSIQQCLQLNRTCPICKQSVSSQPHRLFFSSGNDSVMDDSLIRELRQRIEDTNRELLMANDICEELRAELLLTQIKCKQVEILHKGAVDDCVEEKKENLFLKAAKFSLEGEIEEIKEYTKKEDKKRTDEFAMSLKRINTIHADIAKGLGKEIWIKENQLSNANDKIKRLSAAKSRLEEKLDKLRDENVNNETRSAKPKRFDTEHKKKGGLEDTMEQRFRILEKQMFEMKVENHKKNSKATYNKKKLNTATASDN